MKDLWQIIKFSRDLWPMYFGIIGLTVIFAILSQATPFLTKGIVDTIVANFDSAIPLKPLLVFTALIFVAEVAMTLLSNLQGYIGDIVSIKLNRLMSERYLAHLLSLPQSYFDNELTGKIISRLNRSISEITTFMQTFTNNFMQMIFGAFVTLFIIAYYSWPVAIFLAALFPLYFWLTRLSSNDWKKQQKKILGHTDFAHGRFAEVVGQIRVVKSFVQEKVERRVYKNEFDSVEATTKRQSRKWHN